MAYFKNVKSIEDLKNQFKKLAKTNHPDAGGDAEKMKTINQEFDALFPIWKHRHNTTATEPTTETAESTRKQFYTEYGWAGDKYDINLSLKDIAKNIRLYVKELYPTYKFSITTSYASMCQELHIALMEAPQDIYITDPSELTQEQRYDLARKLRYNNIFNLDCYKDEQLDEAIILAWEKSDNYKITNELATEIIADVYREAQSYNYDDSDSMIDYFSNNFYFFGVKVGKWDKPFKVVEKTARIKKTPETTTLANISA